MPILTISSSNKKLQFPKNVTALAFNAQFPTNGLFAPISFFGACLNLRFFGALSSVNLEDA